MRAGWMFLTALLLAGGLAAGALEKVRIGVVMDGPWVGNSAVEALTKAEILSLTEGEFEVTFPEDAFRVSDWTLNGIRGEVQELLNDPEVDLVLAWGVLASHSLCCISDLPKPVVAPVVLDSELQDLPLKDGTSGVRNLSYVALPDNTLNDLRLFREIAPFQKVAFLINRPLAEAIPQLEMRTRFLVDALGFDFEYIPVDSSAEEALGAISADVDAVYLWPLLQLAPKEFQALVDGLNARRLPTFSALGGSELEAGVLASAGVDGFFQRLSRRVALNVQRILLGEAAGSIPVAFTLRERPTLNLATARKIGLSPRWEVLLEAQIIDREEESGRPRLSLDKAVEAAIEANLDLAVDRRRVAAREQDIARVRGSFYPNWTSTAPGRRSMMIARLPACRRRERLGPAWWAISSSTRRTPGPASKPRNMHSGPKKRPMTSSASISPSIPP